MTMNHIIKLLLINVQRVCVYVCVIFNNIIINLFIHCHNIQIDTNATLCYNI